MSASESVLIHRGCLIRFQCKWMKTNSGIQSVLNVNVFQYCHEGQYFRKLKYDVDDTLQRIIEGKCHIFSCDKVVCHATGVIEPCVLLQCSTAQLSCYKVYQLRNLVSLIKLLDSEKTNLLQDLESNQCFIVNGPSLLCVNMCKKEVAYLETSEADTVIKATFSPNVNGKVFLLQTRGSINTPRYTFIGHKSSETLIAEHCTTSVKHNDVKKGWIHLEVIISCTLDEISVICLEDYNQLPAVYSTIATAVYSLQDCREDHSFLVTTTFGQLVKITDKKVSNVCDIPLSHCNFIYVVGGGGHEVVVLVDQTAKRSCAVSLSKFSIAKVWNSTSHVACGVLVSDNGTEETIAVFHSHIGGNLVDHTSHTLIRDSKDAVKEKVNTSDSTFQLKSSVDLSELPMDTECDLFSSPPPHAGSSTEESSALLKVIESFDNSVDKHRRTVSDMRRTLAQLNQVSSNANQALLKMNNNLKLNEASANENLKENHFVDLVDLFSAEPFPPQTLDDEVKQLKCLLQVNKTWRRVVYDQWIIGFHLKNCCEKWFRRFSVLLHPRSSNEVSSVCPKLQPITTKHFTLSNLPKKGLKTDFDARNDETVGIGPGTEFIVTARLGLSSVIAASQFGSSYPAAIMATTQGKQHSREYCSIFQAGDVHVSATEMATDALAIQVERFNDAISNQWIEDYTAIRAFHDYNNILHLSSTTCDVETMSKVALRSIGFKHYQHMDMYLCERVGALYLALVEFQAIGMQKAFIHISCKSQCEESLLVSYILEQFPNQLEIQAKSKQDFDEQCIGASKSFV